MFFQDKHNFTLLLVTQSRGFKFYLHLGITNLNSCFLNDVKFGGQPLGIAADVLRPTYTDIFSSEDCQKKCQKYPNEECNFFRWVSNDAKNVDKINNCWLMSAKGTEKAKPGHISGPKYCPEGNINYKWLIANVYKLKVYYV